MKGDFGMAEMVLVYASMTGNTEEFWQRNAQDCHGLIYKHFRSWVVLLEVVLYFVVLVHLARSFFGCLLDSLKKLIRIR